MGSIYKNTKYGFTKKFTDNLNRMDKTLNKTSNLNNSNINDKYNKEISRLNALKNEVQNSYSNKAQATAQDFERVTNPFSMQNTDGIGNGQKVGLGGKLSETSMLSTLNSAQNRNAQAINTTGSILQSIDNDMEKAKATRDVDLAKSAQNKFDLILNNFYQINDMFVSNQDLIRKLKD